MKTFEDFEITNDKQKVAVQKIKDNINKWLFFSGACGTGKDLLSDIILSIKTQEKKVCYKINAFRLLLKFKCEFLQSLEHLEKIMLSDVFVINEIEKFWKTSSENEKQILFEIIDECYQHDVQLIIISNLTWGELKDEGIVTPAISDRFAEKGEVINFDWDSYRRKEIE